MSNVTILTGLTRTPHAHPAPTARRILVLNLMPNRAVTEQQFARILGATGTDVAITFALPSTHHIRRNEAILRAAYANFADIRDQYFDALIVTGAPLDQVEFATVDYWPELQDILEWRHTHVATSLFICWGAYAAGAIDGVFAGVQLDHKISGIYSANGFTMPQSRYFTIPETSVRRGTVIAGSEALGALIVTEPTTHSLYVAGHFEYLTATLADEYHRDHRKHDAAVRPANYFDANMQPVNSWNRDAVRFYSDWLESIPATTPQQA